MCAAQAPHSATPGDAAYYEGKPVRLVPTRVERGRELVVGGTFLGPLLSESKPKDHRPNLYVVCPGNQYHDEKEDGLGFNVVLSWLPRNDDAVNWDVYWAVVLDPALETNVRSERDLLLAAQGLFTTGEELALEDLPGFALLRENLHITSLSGLAPFREPDGSLPRLLIVPSHLVVRAAIGSEPPSAVSRLSRAFSYFSRHKNSAPSETEK
jgi:hypothetical protein